MNTDGEHGTVYDPAETPDAEPICDRCEDRLLVATVHGGSLTFRPCPKCVPDVAVRHA